MRIFVVEDCVPVRERLIELIEALGGHAVVGEAGNYHDAVAGICNSNPDVGIFDIRLAGGNGLDALVAVKRKLPGLRAIMLSNQASKQHMKASAHAGAEYFLDKTQEFDKIGEVLVDMQRMNE